MEQNNQNKTNETSAYNEAELQIYRLNKSWTICNESMRTGNFQTWKTELEIVWNELYADIEKVLGETTAAEIIKENDELVQNISKSQGAVFWGALGIRHRFLKKLQTRLGKGGKFENPELQRSIE